MKFVTLDGFKTMFDGLSISLPGHEQVCYPATGKDQVIERVGDADGLIRNSVPIDREIIEGCPNLKLICTCGTGYDKIDLEAAAERGVTVCNVPGYSTAAVSQHTMALLLEIVNRVSVFDGMVRAGVWAKGGGRKIAEVTTYELLGKTMGIFGAGDIGRAVARAAQGFGMQVIAYRRNPPKDQADGIRYVDFETLLRESDVFSIHAPLTNETRGVINASAIAKMRDGAILLNTSRGAVMDEAAVAQALDSGKLLGLGADVLSQEPPQDSPLVGHPKAVITPHIAWAPTETRQRLMDELSANILAFVAGKPRNTVEL